MDEYKEVWMVHDPKSGYIEALYFDKTKASEHLAMIKTNSSFYDNAENFKISGPLRVY